jgi:hypothetical protein
VPSKCTQKKKIKSEEEWKHAQEEKAQWNKFSWIIMTKF